MLGIMCGIVFILASVGAAAVAFNQENPVTDESVGAPAVRLSPAPYPDSVSDETEYARWLFRRSNDLLRAAEDADDPRARVELGVAGVNWMLAAECEPPMSRWLHDIGLASDETFVLELTQRSLMALAAAREDLDRYAALDEAEPELVEDSRSHLDLLETFARALNARMLPAGVDNNEKRRQAASALSTYVEDDRSKVAAAALLWQVALYRHGDRIDRALRLLPLAVDRPQRDTLNYDFFLRLMRCEYLRRRDSNATAWGLLLLLEERSREWFPTGRQREEAARATVLAKLAVCDAWSRSGDDDERERTGSWCREHTTRLRDDYFRSDTDPTVLRLATAVPFLVDIPELDVEPKPSTPDDDAPSASGDDTVTPSPRP